MFFKVCKFGGSSVADAGMFVRVNRILQDDPTRRYIILSAPGKRSMADEKITDLFYRAHASACAGDDSILANIFLRYASIRDSLAPDFDLETEFAHIRTKLHLSRDYAASRGEYLCAKLFAAYTGLPFVDAANLLFFDAGGEIDEPRSRAAVQECLSSMEYAVIPGFYGANPDGSIKTFSRGGSDVTGALISAFLGAGLYENWTDVDGLYTADPGIAPCAIRNLTVSMKQMRRISEAGAQLLHPDALTPLEGSGIDTVLKNTFCPGAEGTRITEGFCGSVRCVTGKRRMYMIGDSASRTSSPLLHSLPVQGAIPIAVVNAFGLKEKAVRCIQSILKPIHIIHMQDHIQIIIPEKEYAYAIRTIHGIMIEE